MPVFFKNKQRYRSFFFLNEFNLKYNILRGREANEVPISSQIQIASTTFRQLLNITKIVKVGNTFSYGFLGLDLSPKTMNRPDPADLSPIHLRFGKLSVFQIINLCSGI